MTEARAKQIAGVISDNIAQGVAVAGAVVALYLFDWPLAVMWFYIPASVVIGSLIGIYRTSEKEGMTPEPNGKTSDNFKRI